ncbi:hypothetical protein MLD38_029983 [Melastoma candidum]|uniref:Uncharacterized protein n=1 Tax=Melastoma candidum TaxID=119954 RepID=A0ACB9MLJ3_9MYRT|nr:hypothetical protein MLD38_029983 [Melastoma candidum]
MASRFWNQGDDSDTEEENSDYESDDEEREVDNSAPTTTSKYLKGNDSDSDDSDAQKRVVRSAKDKRFEEMSSTVDRMKNAMKIDDLG